MPAPNTPLTALTRYAGSSQTACFVQNLGTNPLYVKFGTGCSTSDFHFILAAGSSANDGTGGMFSWNYYFGPVTVAGTSPNYIMWSQNGQ